MDRVQRDTDTLTGVTGVTFPIVGETSFTFPNGTGGPEANLTADQRRTLYSVLHLSDVACGSEQ